MTELHDKAYEKLLKYAEEKDIDMYIQVFSTAFHTSYSFNYWSDNNDDSIQVLVEYEKISIPDGNVVITAPDSRLVDKLYDICTRQAEIREIQANEFRDKFIKDTFNL